MAKHIIVHPGGVHHDEILAVALICHSEGVLPVFRRRPTDEDLSDPEVWVVDIGGLHEPERRNFDHHQLAREAAPECAMSLVARHLEIHELLGMRPWYEAQVVLDSKGPQELARRLELERGIPPALTSPLDVALLRLFAGRGEGEVDPAVVQMLARVGGALVAEAHSFRSELHRCRDLTETRTVGGLPVVVHHARIRDSVSRQLCHEWEQEHGQAIVVSVSHDSRSPTGWALDRIDDDPRIDFSRIDGDPRIGFAHKMGFVAKTRERLGLDEIDELIRRAIVDPG